MLNRRRFLEVVGILALWPYGCRSKKANKGNVGQRKKGSFITTSYVIAVPCIGTKDTACVDVCPVDAIHPRRDEGEFKSEEMLYIHPDKCINCGACQPACPVEAIFSGDNVPEKWNDYIRRNAVYYGSVPKIAS